jgi:DNA polymerase III delta subunit
VTTDANRREFALIEAANVGDTAAAHALLDHLRDQDEEALANELAPLLQAEGGPRKWTLHRRSELP